jgi:hypothetical protein
LAELEIGDDPVKDLLSTPFGVYFNSLLERLSAHKVLFDIELRAGRHTSLKDFVKKVTLDLEDREDFMQQSQVRQHLKDQKRTRDRKGSILRILFIPSLLTIKGAFHESIRHWIQPPEFKADFDKAKKARDVGSCVWLQSESAYVSWKAALRTTESGPGNHGKSKAQPRQPILLFEGRALANLGNGNIDSSVKQDLLALERQYYRRL